MGKEGIWEIDILVTNRYCNDGSFQKMLFQKLVV